MSASLLFSIKSCQRPDASNRFEAHRRRARALAASQTQVRHARLADGRARLRQCGRARREPRRQRGRRHGRRRTRTNAHAHRVRTPHMRQRTHAPTLACANAHAAAQTHVTPRWSCGYSYPYVHMGPHTRGSH
eukprot:6191735-Pleurochrysis_carterae.AAC.1